MTDTPLALDAYTRLADAYAARIDVKPHNAFYDRPAVLSLLPPVAGRRVLDAGCGPGAYAAALADLGAEVVGVDACPRMLDHARERLAGRAAFAEADLGKRLDFADEAFDLVLSALALDYVRDWDHVFAEFSRVLRPGGHVVFSSQHPAAEFYTYHPGGVYFDTERVACDWRGFGVTVNMPYYRRPLQAMLSPLLAAGFVLERVLEPRPVEAFREHDARNYEVLMRRPGFIVFRGRKPG